MTSLKLQRKLDKIRSMTFLIDNSNKVPNTRLHSVLSFLKYLLLHSIFCYLFSVFIGWIQMNIYIYGIDGKKGAFSSEFAGMYVMVAAYILGPLNCLLTSPLHLLIYFKKSGRSRYCYSIAASAGVSVLVLHFLTYASSR
jgi:hypothetical protein